MVTESSPRMMGIHGVSIPKADCPSRLSWAPRYTKCFPDLQNTPGKTEFSPDGSSSLAEKVLPWNSKVSLTALYYIHWEVFALLSYTDSSAWNIPQEIRGKWMRIFCFGFSFLACTGCGIAPKIPGSTLVNDNSQLKSLTEPIICCWSNSSNSSNSCVYEAFCQTIWCMSVSLAGRQGPTKAWKQFSLSERERRCEVVGVNYSPTVNREKEREEA